MKQSKKFVCLLSVVAAGLTMVSCGNSSVVGSSVKPSSTTSSPISSTVVSSTTPSSTAPSSVASSEIALDTATAWGYLAFDESNPDITFTNWVEKGTWTASDNGIHLAGAGSVTNKVKVANDKPYLYITAGSYAATKAPTLKVTFAGTAVKAVGYTTDAITLPIGVKTVYGYNYDLSAYKGQTGLIVVSQDNAAADDFQLTKIEFKDNDAGFNADTSTLTEWLEKDDIVADWPIAGNYRSGVGEGYDINSYDNEVVSSVSKYIKIDNDNPIMKLKFRMFRGQDGSNDEESGYRKSILGVRVNGVAVPAYAYDGANYVHSDTDAGTYYFFDMSAYKGKTVNVYIGNDAYKTTGHMVLQGIKFEAALPASTTKASYTGAEMATEWVNINAAAEGDYLSYNSYDAWGSTAKAIAVTANNDKMTVTYHSAAAYLEDNGHKSDIQAHDGNINPDYQVKANYATIPYIGGTATKVEDTYYEVDITKSADVTASYDLSAYVGKTIFVQIIQQNDWNEHALITSVAFAAIA